MRLFLLKTLPYIKLMFGKRDESSSEPDIGKDMNFVRFSAKRLFCRNSLSARPAQAHRLKSPARSASELWAPETNINHRLVISRRRYFSEKSDYFVCHVIKVYPEHQ